MQAAHSVRSNRKKTIFFWHISLCSLLVISLAIPALGVVGSQAWADEKQSEFLFSIHQQEITEALKEVATKAGYQLLFSAEQVGVQKATSLSGRYTAEEALSLLLQDTGLSFEITARGVIVIKKDHLKNPEEEEDMNIKRNFLSGIIGSLIGIGSVQGLEAQELNSPDQPSVRALEEIVVTALRREGSVQSIPVSISAVSGQELDSRGISSFRELGEAVSGLALVQPEGFTSSSIYVRGVGTTGNNPADSSVGVVVDGVYQLKLGAVFSEMLDVERVEVLRGPQGTLFGKNTTAGLIVIKTNDPDTEKFSGRMQGIVGNLDNRELRGVVNIPLIEGKLAARMSGFIADRDGYTENLYIGKDTRNIDREGFRGKLLWNINDSLSIVLSGEKIEQESRTDKSLVEYPPNFLAGYSDLLPPIGIGKAQQNESWVSDEVERYIATVNWDIPNHRVTSISAYEESSGAIYADSDHTILANELGPATLTSIFNIAETEVLTQELQLSSYWQGPINYILGAFWQNENLVSDTTLFMGGNDAGIIRPPSLRDVDSKALFGNVSYQFNEYWDASLGVRYTEDEKEGQNNLFSGMVTFDETTYSLKLRYTPDDSKMFYFGYDTGFKSGGINREFNRCNVGGMCLSDSQALWDPETTDNYEIGMKSSWFDNTLRFNAALFYQIYEDYQVSQFIPGEGTTITTNAAKVVSKGVEADFNWLLGSGFSLSGNLSYIQTEYDNYENAPCALPTTPGCIGGAQDLSGKRLDQAPKLSYTLAAEYRDSVDYLGQIEWFARLENIYKSDHNLYLFLPPETGQDGYHLLNARIGFELPDSWRVTGWVRNLTDKEYLVSGELSGAGLRLVPGVPRTYGVTLDWHF